MGLWHSIVVLELRQFFRGDGIEYPLILYSGSGDVCSQESVTFGGRRRGSIGGVE